MAVNRPARWLLMAGHVPSDGRGGGIVRYTIELARALRQRDDVELHLLASPQAADSLSELTGSSERVVRLPAVPPMAVPAAERWLIGRRLAGRFDVVHGVKHLVPRGTGTPTALTVHDMLPFDRPADFPLAKRLLLQRPYAASLHQADRLLCVSRATMARLTDRFPEVADRCSVVPLATSPTLLGSPPEAVTALAGRPFALVVGDPSPRKNLSVVVAAWERVVHRRPDAVLVLVGPPAWAGAHYGPQYGDLVASGHVLQLTGVDDGILRWCYENASVVLAPSLMEGFGLPAVEAVDLGAPLVTSQDPALVEVSGKLAEHLPADDVQAWVDASLRHLAGRPVDGVGRPEPRTWSEVAAETVTAVCGSSTGGSPDGGTAPIA
jgi:glycosyltransferase involved in cell wall biosynthesis